VISDSGKFITNSARWCLDLRYEGALRISAAKGLRVNNEAWVTQPIPREAWDEAPPSKPKMRWRMVAVMAAVVLGCGAAAFLVHLGSTVNRQAEQIEQVGIIQMPDRTSGVAGAGTTPEPDPAPGGTGAGTQTTKAPSSSEDPTSETSSTETTSETTSTTESTSGGNPATTTAPGTTSKPANAPPKPPATTTKTTSCVLLIFCSVS
jgi:hypothetical protein